MYSDDKKIVMTHIIMYLLLNGVFKYYVSTGLSREGGVIIYSDDMKIVMTHIIMYLLLN